jgi:glucose/arabinose dehydrogenase
MTRIRIVFVFCLWFISMLHILPCFADDSIGEIISLPPGFAISTYAENVPNARSMAISQRNILFVGSMNAGKVYAVVDKNGDFKADEVITVASGLNMPNGVALYDRDLYVAEIDRIIKFAAIEERLHNPGKPEIVFHRLPREKWHGWKFIKFGPDGKLYVPIGYRISLVRLVNSIPIGYEVFAQGWLQGDHVLGRPVDLEIMQDGSLLVSDDYCGKIYRITYNGEKN